MYVGTVPEIQRSPRDMTTQGLEFALELSRERSLELRDANDQSDEFLLGMIRRYYIREELERRELVKRRAM